jgi:restriction system protein
MLPMLQVLSDGREWSASVLRAELAKRFRLSPNEVSELQPSGKTQVFSNRMHWARLYLDNAGLIKTPRRGHYCITPRGREAIASGREGLDLEYLSQFPEFRAFYTKTTTPTVHDDPTPSLASVNAATSAASSTPASPEDALSDSYSTYKRGVEAELLQTVRTVNPEFFERLVVDLLLKMGYGGSFKEAGRALGRTGDGGLDGVIKEDRLGLDVLYVQAKRWQNTVGRPEIQTFAGSLDGVRARKGVFITTSQFSAEARQYADRIEKRIVLIDGEELARLMFEHNVGVTSVASLDIKRVDADYFADE